MNMHMNMNINMNINSIQDNDDGDDDDDETQTQTNRKRTGHRSIRVLTFTLLLCLLGIAALRWFNVYEFQPLLQDHNSRNVKKQTRHFEQDYFAPSINFRSSERSQYQEDLKLMQDSCLEPVRGLEWEVFRPTASGPVSASTGTTATTTTTTTTHYTTTRNSTETGTSTGTQKRLLIALYAGFDEYAHFLDHSAKIAKLYATLWGPHVTVLVLQGTAFAPRGCQPPGIHTTLNKIRLLFHAIDRTDGESRQQPEEQSYDQLLLMDADTLLVNMTIDVTTLLPNNKHLLATGPIHHKTNIPTGVTLWNLHHPEIRTVAMDWFSRSTEAVKKGNYKGDQDHLLVSPQLYTERSEFATKGTVVRHYKKREHADLQERQGVLSRRADRICREYQSVCPDLEKAYESTNR
jgi:hypothetical protein